MLKVAFICFFPSISPKQFQKLYASIRSEPFKIPEDDGNDLTLTFFNPDREGWLLKMGETTIQKQNKEKNKQTKTGSAFSPYLYSI